MVLEGLKGKNSCLWQEELVGWIELQVQLLLLPTPTKSFKQRTLMIQRNVKEEKNTYKEMEKRKYIMRGLAVLFVKCHGTMNFPHSP